MLDYKRILAPVDLASISHSVLERAARHSQESGSEFWVTHVVDTELHQYPGFESIADASDQSVLLENAKTQLDILLEEHEIGYCETLVTAGQTVPTLIRVIEEKNIDLVVMGSHRDHSSSPMYQNVTSSIIESVVCDVLVLHR